MAAEAFARCCLAQAAKQARDKQLADIVESAGQRPQVGCVLDLLHMCACYAVLVLHADAAPTCMCGPWPGALLTPSSPDSQSLPGIVQAGGGQMLRIDLREAAVVQNPTSGGGLGDVAEE